MEDTSQKILIVESEDGEIRINLDLCFDAAESAIEELYDMVDEVEEFDYGTSIHRLLECSIGELLRIGYTKSEITEIVQAEFDDFNKSLH